VRAEPDLKVKGETAFVPFHSPDPGLTSGFDDAAPPCVTAQIAMF
jgi:hypothetical protein